MPDWYFTSTPSAEDGSKAWAINFDDGLSWAREKATESLQVRCVRAGLGICPYGYVGPDCAPCPGGVASPCHENGTCYFNGAGAMGKRSAPSTPAHIGSPLASNL